MLNLNSDFNVHPRKRISPTPTRDWAGRTMPRTLDEVYGRYSDAKRHAYDYCINLMRRYNGHNFAITSHNTFMFVVSFDFPNPETGEAMRAIITRDHNDAYFIG